MHVRKCIRNLDISWLPIGVDTAHIEFATSMEGDGDDKGYDQDASIHDKAMKRQEDDYARGDVGATVENVADDVNDAVDGTDQRPPSAEKPYN